MIRMIGFSISILSLVNRIFVKCHGFAELHALDFHIARQRTCGKVMFTARKRSLRRLCFYTCMSVILFTGGCLPQCMLGYTPEEQTPPRADIPRSRNPSPGQTPLLPSACWEIWTTNRRCASYWNGYLFHMRVPVHRGVVVVCLVPGPFWWICLVHPLGRYTPSPGRYILWY